MSENNENIGIEMMESAINKFKECLNKNVSATDVIDDPEAAFFVKASFDLIDGYIRHEKEMQRKLDNIEEKLNMIGDVSRSIESLRHEIQNMKKES